MDDRERALIIAMVYVPLLGAAHLAQAAEGITLLPARMSLVRAIVVEEDIMPPVVRNKLLVEYLYEGDDRVTGQTFQCESAAEFPQGNWPTLIVPRLAIGERGIWLIEEANHKLYPKGMYNYTRWPARLDPSARGRARYQTIRAFADTVEGVARLRKNSEKISELKRLTTDENPYVSSWAVSRLAVAATDDEDIAIFLDRLVEVAGAPAQGQVELDKALIDVRGAAWRESEQRFALFREWFRGEPSAKDAALVMHRLSVVSQHPNTQGFPQEQLLEMIRLLARNDHFPLSKRENSRSLLMWAAMRYDTDEKVFECAAELVGSDLPEEIRRSVAWVFVHNFDLDEPRRETLRGLRSKTKEKPVLDALEAALARPDKLDSR